MLNANPKLFTRALLKGYYLLAFKSILCLFAITFDNQTTL